MDVLRPLYCLRYSLILRAFTYASYRDGLTSREFVDMAEQARIEGARVTNQFISHQSLKRPALPCRPIAIGRPGSWMIRFARSFYVPCEAARRQAASSTKTT